MQELQTVEEVVQAVGGPAAMARLTGRKDQDIWNWKNDGRIPAKFYLRISDKLKEDHKAAPASLFGMLEPTSERIAS